MNSKHQSQMDLDSGNNKSIVVSYYGESLLSSSNRGNILLPRFFILTKSYYVTFVTIYTVELVEVHLFFLHLYIHKCISITMQLGLYRLKLDICHYISCSNIPAKSTFTSRPTQPRHHRRTIT